MPGNRKMPSAITRNQLRALATRKDVDKKFATKQDFETLRKELIVKIATTATSQKIEPWGADIRELLYKIAACATKQDLETWGFALRAEFLASNEALRSDMKTMGGRIVTIGDRVDTLEDRIAAKLSIELARHVNASLEDTRSQITTIDDKYADLPDRVTTLEQIVVKP